MKKRIKLSTTHIILLSFMLLILLGGILLSLPVSHSEGADIAFEDAMFTAVSATCVTGLVTLPTVAVWSVFGQVVILILIQVGGLGVITVMSWLMMLFHRRIGMSSYILLQDSFNLNSMDGLVRFVKRVIIGTFAVEGAGALLYMTVFIPDFGLKGIWISVFTAVSAFCNAGIDIIAENSLCGYALDPIVNSVTMLLIVIGGIGFPVWWDVLRVLKRRRRRKRLRELTLHSKIALSTTFILILTGALLIFAFEYNNPDTMADNTLTEKLGLSLFQSVTTRTAGFATLPQENLSNPTGIVCLLLMFIGGSPVGTAGGIKTVTFAVIAASAVATVRRREDTVLFGRRLNRESVSKAAAVAFTSFFIMFTSTLLLSYVSSADLLDILYETVSATATVGLTRALTPTFNIWGKVIIMFTMYLGRVGPISLAIAFNLKNQNQNLIKEPTEEISVG